MQWYIAGFSTDSAQGTIHLDFAMPGENQSRLLKASANLIICVFFDLMPGENQSRLLKASANLIICVFFDFAGKSGHASTDDEIKDCIKNNPPTANYESWGRKRYNCKDWAVEAAANCGLNCG